MTTKTEWHASRGQYDGCRRLPALAAILCVWLGCANESKTVVNQDQSDGVAGRSGFGGQVGAFGGASFVYASANASTAGTAGVAGSLSGTADAETLDRVIERFCVIPDVAACMAGCLANHQYEARQFPNCTEEFRRLMICQAALEPQLRDCEDEAVTSPIMCVDEDDAYRLCILE